MGNEKYRPVCMFRNGYHDVRKPSRSFLFLINPISPHQCREEAIDRTQTLITDLNIQVCDTTNYEQQISEKTGCDLFQSLNNHCVK